MDAAAAAPASFSFLALFLQADWVVKGVMIGLVLASLGSWAVILDKLFRFGALNSAADRFEAQVGAGRSLEDVAGEAGANPRHPLPRMLQAANAAVLPLQCISPFFIPKPRYAPASPPIAMLPAVMLAPM